MLSKTAISTPISRAAWWLPCLLGGTAAVHAAPADAPAATAAAAATYYRVINLGSDSLSTLPVINASGQVIFSVNDATGSHAWFYDGRTVRNIGTLGGPDVYAPALNDAGQVAGAADTSAGFFHAFRWSASTGMTDLGVINGGPNSYGKAINKDGWVVGASDIGSSVQPVHAFRWSAATGMQDLGSTFGDALSLSEATAINDAGVIAGDAETGGPFYYNHSFAWTKATGMVDLGTLGGNYAYTAAIDAAGRITGYADLPDGNNHAFLWTRRGGIRDLGTAGGTESFPLAMSPGGHMVGVINLADGNQHAMSWTRAGGMVDLGTLGGAGSRALGVNNNGQVVGTSTTTSRAAPSAAFLWSAARGMVDLNTRVHHLPGGLRLESADAISDKGEIVAETNAGLVLLKPIGQRASGPALGPITGAEVVTAGAPFNASASFANEDTGESHSLSLDWGDGSRDAPLKPSERGGAGSASAMHVYTRPGIYTVTAQVTDHAGNSAAVSRKVVVVEPSAGFAAGMGAFVSSPGAIRKAPAQSGKAKFAFFAQAPGTAAGQGAKPLLVFDTGGFGFRSEDFKPVAVQGGTVRLEGSGKTTQDQGGAYRFSLVTTAGAADAGRFDLKVWHADPATRAQVVDYDSQAGKGGARSGTMVEGRIAVQ